MKAWNDDMNVPSQFDQKLTFLLEINFNNSEICISTFFFLPKAIVVQQFSLNIKWWHCFGYE